MRVLFWILVALIGLVLAAFAASNRQTFALGLWPLPWLLEVPAYLAVLGTLLLGFIAGALAAWIGGRFCRRERRRRGRRIAALERELAATQAQLANAPGSAPVAAKG
jgi:lipopolysaccharide assembly protein A